MTPIDPDIPYRPEFIQSGKNEWDVPEIPMMKVEAELVDWTRAALGAEHIRKKIEDCCSSQTLQLPPAISELKYVGITEVPGGLAFRFMTRKASGGVRIDPIVVPLAEKETYTLDSDEVSKKVLDAVKTGLPNLLR